MFGQFDPGKGQAMKTLLVDDQPLFLEGLRNFLRAKGFEVVGTARNGLEALMKYELLQPDLVLLDLQMANCDGIETTRMLKKEYPAANIVILTASEDESSRLAALQAGAAGYLLKSMESQEFLSKLEGFNRDADLPATALTGRTPQQLVCLEAAEHSAGLELSERQLDIVKSLARGLSYKEIADLLNLKETTIKYHLAEILTKLHLDNKAQLIAYAVKNRLI